MLGINKRPGSQTSAAPYRATDHSLSNTAVVQWCRQIKYFKHTENMMKRTSYLLAFAELIRKLWKIMNKCEAASTLMARSLAVSVWVKPASNVIAKGLNLIADGVVFPFHANYFQPQTLGKLVTHVSGLVWRWSWHNLAIGPMMMGWNICIQIFYEYFNIYI